MALTKVSTGMLSADVASIDLNIDANTMYIDVSNNRVGINNAAPSTALDVTGTVTADGLTVEAASGAEAARFVTNDATAANNAGALIYNIASATAATRNSQLILDPSGANASGGDYLIISAKGDNSASIINYHATSTLALGTAGVERMRIDSSGNVGIGVVPSAFLLPNGSTGALQLQSGGLLSAYNGNTYLSQNWYYNAGEKYIANGSASRYEQRGAEHIWSSAGNNTSGAGAGLTWSEAMRIDASGNLLVGTAVSNARLTVKSNAGAILGFGVYGDTTGDTVYNVAQFGKFDNNTTTSQVFINFIVNNGTVAQGQINANGAGAVAFGSWSDSRLKENITDLPSQLANITALRPVEFDYIESEGGEHQIGFVAQEVEEIYPDLVGERQDGMKTLSGMGKMEARLIKAIQEQQATIEALTARIAALES